MNRQWLQWLRTFAVGVLLSACGGGGGGGGDSAPPTTTAPPSTAVPLAASSAKGYLQTGQLALGDLDAALQSETGLVVTQQSGPAVEFKLGAGNVLNYLAPVEQHGDSTSVLRITNAAGTKAWTLSLAWTSRVGASLSRISEASQSGPPAEDGVTFTPTGIGLDGHVGTGTTALSYKLGGAQTLDPAKMLVSLHTPTGDQNVTAWFTLDAATGTITLTAASLPQLLSSVQAANVATLAFSLSTPRYAKTYGFEHTLTYAAGRLNLAVVNADGSAAGDFAGVKFVARGFNTGAAFLGQLDATAKLAFTGLPADTYEVNQVLLGNGVRLTGFATLPTSTSTVALTIAKVPGATPSATSNFASAQAVVISGPGREVPARQLGDGPRTPDEKALAIPANATYTATVTAGARDTLITTLVNYTVPRGTTKLSVYLEVTTAEFPTFTGQQSVFNDLWLFDVKLPGAIGNLQQTGKVNQTHATKGTITFEKCLDVTAELKDASFAITGQLGAQNVADSALATSVTLAISLSCAGALNITEFKGEATTPDKLFSLYPRRAAKTEDTKDGNVAGQFVSIPRVAQLPASFGIPATLKYDPPSATATQVEILQRTASGDASLGTNYLGQATATAPGVLTFTGLLLNPTALPPVTGRVQLVAVLSATVDGVTVKSQPSPLTVEDKYSNFTPIYLTSELTGYDTTKRYAGHNEAGGDSWATAAMATWISTLGLYYNDISAANVKQTATSRSVLGHSGHSDAQQADLLYWNGSGGFSETFPGPQADAVTALATAAQAEVAANANPAPNVAKLVAWINENRTNLGSYAGRAEVRRIYIGNAHVAELLIDGLFPGTFSLVPGITAWTAKSAKIMPEDSHLDHWHVSTKNE